MRNCLHVSLGNQLACTQLMFVFETISGRTSAARQCAHSVIIWPEVGQAHRTHHAHIHMRAAQATALGSVLIAFGSERWGPSVRGALIDSRPTARLKPALSDVIAISAAGPHHSRGKCHGCPADRPANELHFIFDCHINQGGFNWCGAPR